jgi:hypothetical protein
MSGLAGTTLSAVEDSLRSYAALRSGELIPTAGRSEPWEVLILADSAQQNVTVQYPGDFFEWDDASAFLSRSLGVPVFSFHIHDDDLWMYVLFNGGEEIDHFNPIPDYWDDAISEEETATWAGNAGVIAEAWPDVEADAVRNYLVRWDLDDDAPGRAYANDRFPYDDCWQLTGFMKRLGLTYPLDDHGRVIGRTYRFRVKQQA